MWEWIIEEFACYKRDVKGLPHAPTFQKYLVGKGFDERIEVEDEAPGPSEGGDGSPSEAIKLSPAASTIYRLLKKATESNRKMPTLDVLENDYQIDRHTSVAAYQELEAQGLVLKEGRRWHLTDI